MLFQKILSRNNLANRYNKIGEKSSKVIFNFPKNLYNVILRPEKFAFCFC